MRDPCNALINYNAQKVELVDLINLIIILSLGMTLGCLKNSIHLDLKTLSLNLFYEAML